MTDTNQNEINNLGNELLDLIEKYKDKLPPYEVGNLLISQATGLMLCCAPNELVGVKTIFACIENGIALYEETHS